MAGIWGAGLLPAHAADLDVVLAAKSGQVAVVRELVRRHHDVNAAEPDGTTALMWAVRNGDLETQQLLLHAGANASTANRYGVTALSLAASSGNAAVLDLLLKAGADSGSAERTLPDGQTLLMLAARSGSIDAMTRIIRLGCDVNAVERRTGTSALVWAVMSNSSRAVQLLVDSGADINAPSAITHFPHTAPKVTGDRLEPGFSYVGQTVLPKGGWTPLMYAAREGAVDSSQTLTSAGADLDVRDPDGTSALLFAIINGHYDVAAVLIEGGADLDLADNAGMTPLYAAVDMHTLGSTFGRPDPPLTVFEGSIPMMQMLLDYGADPNVRLKSKILKRVYNAGDARLDEGATPLMRAARGGDSTAMRVLLEHGADPTLTQKNGNTPLILAAGIGVRGNYPDRGSEASALQVIQLCLDRGLDINATNAAGDTAVHAAALGSPSIVRFLAEHGARLDVKNKRGLTPLAAALAGRNADAQTVVLLRGLSGAAPAEAAARGPE
jgi:ankyrin repeat protein